MRDRWVRSAFLGLILGLPLLIHAASPHPHPPPVASGPGASWDSCSTWPAIGEVVVASGLAFVARQRNLLLAARGVRG